MFWKPLLVVLFGLSAVFSVEAGGPNSEVQYFKQHVRLVDGKLEVTDSVALVIYNAFGNEEVSVAYEKTDKLKVFKAWVEDMNGKKLYKVPDKMFEDRNQYQSSAMYADCRERTCKTDFALYPHRFVYTSTIVSDEFTNLAHWNPRSYRSRPLRNAELWIHRPLSVDVRTKYEGITDVVSDTTGQQITTRYRLSPILLDDEGTTNPNVVYPRAFVDVVPERFMYGLQGFHTNWSSYGNWVEQLNSGLTNLPEQERLKVRELLSETTDTLERVRILYHYLQDHTRYVNIQLGIGGMKSYPASYVSLNKFGDCKALSNYMKALLEEAGIRSNFVLVNRDVFPEPFYPDFSSSQFNHMLLLVPLGKDTLWLENTSSINSMGFVDVSTQNRPALLLDGINSRLIRTPPFDTESVRGTRKVTLRISADNIAEATISHQGRGWENDHWRAVENEVSTSSQLKYLEPFIPFKHFDMKRCEIKVPFRDEPCAQLDLSLSMSNFMMRTQGATYLPQVSVYQGLNVFSKPDGKTHDFPFPVCQKDTVLYLLPGNLSLESLPAPITLTGPYGSYESMYVPIEGGLMGVKTFHIKAGCYTPDTYRMLYEFVQQISDTEKKSLLLHTL